MPNGLQSSSSWWWCRGSRVAWFLGKRRADGGDIMATPHDVDRQAQFIRLILFILGAILSIVGWARFVGAQPEPPRPAVPVEPIRAILDAFRTHRVVAVTAGHGETRGYAFGQWLVHDPRFIAAINDIVIEEGSSRYQDVADRFVRGENVPMESLRHVWRDTTQPGLGLDRQWEELFQPVRAVNAALPPARRIRVLLGDPPIEW